MHKNYNSCLHILDMYIERGRHQFSQRKQILVKDEVTGIATTLNTDFSNTQGQLTPQLVVSLG